MELEFLRAFQSISNPFFDIFFETTTILGEDLLIIPLIALIYWGINKRFGEYVGFAIFTSYLLNNALKDLFQFKRPIGEEGIRVLREHTAGGYSFPSGHSQGAAAFWGAIAIYLKDKRVYFACAVIIILVGISRMYLGVHYPKDVVAGITIGVLVAFAAYYLYSRIDNKIMLYFIVFLMFIPALFYARSPDFVKAFGTYSGFFLGIVIEKKFVNFTTEIHIIKKIIRISIGVIIVFTLKEGLKICFPDFLIYDFVRYFIFTFFAIGLYPFIFNKYKF